MITIAEWDPEVPVWVATSEDIDGLAIEADTLERLVVRLPTSCRTCSREIIPNSWWVGVTFRSRCTPLVWGGLH